MIVSTGDLPSRGWGYTSKSFEVLPLTYAQLRAYKSEPENTVTQKLVRDIRYLLSDIKDYKTFNLYDLKAIIFMRKYVTITKDKTITLQIPDEKGSEFPISFNIDSVNFNEISKDLINIDSVVLGGVKCKCLLPATIGNFESVLHIFLSRHVEVDLTTLYLAAILGFVESPNDTIARIDSAKYDEIALLNYIYDSLSGATTPVTFKNPATKAEVTVGFDDLIVDLFRCVLQNNRLDKSKIIFR